MNSTYEELLQKQNIFFQSGATRDLSFRINQLKRLQAWIQNNEKRIFDALYQDLRKNEFEAFLTEVMRALREIDDVIKNLKRWARPQRVKTPMFLFRSSSQYYYEPFGSVLVISAWNYPFGLGLMPMIGALAAGNCCVLKPSELALHTSPLLADMIRECFEPEYCAVIEGGVEETTELLKYRFDFIHYTGNSRVGKIIAQAAARHLTPTILELGGKSPCFVDETADIAISAKRICFGKFVNAGQTCVAPDYILVQRKVKNQLIDALKQQISAFYGDFPQKSPDYCRIINERHFDRLSAYLTKDNIVCGGQSDKNDLYIAPTILDNIDWQSPIMQDEIFGPILPILVYDDLSETLSYLRSMDKPLAAYVFSQDKTVQNQIIKDLPFGGGGINTVGFHVVNSNLPFGGVGYSGMGNYQGKSSFESFSHKKSMLNQALWPDINVAFPPYKMKILKWLKRM